MRLSDADNDTPDPSLDEFPSLVPEAAEPPAPDDAVHSRGTAETDAVEGSTLEELPDALEEKEE